MLRFALMALSFLATAPALAADDQLAAGTVVTGEDGPDVPALPTGAMNPKVAAYLEPSVKLEVETIGDLVGSMAKVMQIKGVDVPNTARASHQFASTDYDFAKKLAAEKKYVEAYRMLRDAWLIHREATTYFVEHAEPEVLKTVATKLMATLTQRITDLEPQMASAPEDAKKQFASAKTLYQTAKTTYEQGDAKKGMLKAIGAIVALDEALHTTWKAAM